MKEHYRIEKPCQGVYVVIDDQDGEEMARISRFSTFEHAPMISLRGASLTTPAVAKEVAKAMTKLANELTRSPNKP